MRAVRALPEIRLALLRDLTRRPRSSRSRPGSAGSRSRWSAPGWSPHGGSRRRLLPLLILSRVAAFLPISEIAQVEPPARRYDRLDPAAARRACASRSAVTDGPRAPAGAGRRLGDALRAMCASPIRARAAPALDGVDVRGPGRRDGGDGRAVGRRQDDDRQSAAAFLGSRGRARSCSTASICAISSSTVCAAASRWSRRTRTCSTTRCEANVALARPEATRRRSPARSARRRSPISSRACPRGSTRGSASAACSCPAGSASASRSPAPS